MQCNMLVKVNVEQVNETTPYVYFEVDC
uniref:CSON000574 protein n=1 Tax=Culicoides sonorensis TaxID=179676 RepID=A0A336KUU1_CULSO